jgi:G-protein alpha subunit
MLFFFFFFFLLLPPPPTAATTTTTLLSRYDEKVPGRTEVTRLNAALDLFRQMCNNRWLVNTGIILVFNKRHLFEAKLQVRPLSKYYPQYRGTSTLDAMNYIARMFREAAEELACANVLSTAWISAVDSRSAFRFLRNLHSFLLETALISAASPSIVE